MTAEPFDRALRRLRRDRAAARFGAVADLYDAAAGELVARLLARDRRFAHALDLGCRDGRLRLPAAYVTRLDAGGVWARGGVQADEDRLPFAAEAFDLIASVGALDTVNDLPGCLVQCRRALRPGGVFAAVFPGGDTLATLRAALFAAEEGLTGRVSPRVHPMIDPREMAGLLGRAGFADPVADVEPVALRYRSLAALVADLRAGAMTNVRAERGPPMTRALAAAAAAAFGEQADTAGRVSLRIELTHVAAHAPPMSAR